jgi:DNA-binding response OmpR family regulator
MGLEVRQHSDVQRCLDQWTHQPADLVLWLQPKQSMLLANIRQLRQISEAPLMIADETAPISLQIEAVRAGVDYYFDRLLDPRLCAAYCLNILRRSGGLAVGSLPALQLAGLALDPSTRSCKVDDGESIHLTQLEFKLIYLLMTYNGQVLPIEILIEKVWGYEDFGSSDLVRGLISRLRAKISDPPDKPRFIETIPGFGYRFRIES